MVLPPPCYGRSRPAAKHLDDKIKYFSYGGVGPDAGTAERIVSILRPRFELATVAGDTPACPRVPADLPSSRSSTLASTPWPTTAAVLFSGPAGSGKTLLAMEAARREVAVGKSGRLLCFNRLLGKRLTADMADVDGLTVGHLPPGAAAYRRTSPVPPAWIARVLESRSFPRRGPGGAARRPGSGRRLPDRRRDPRHRQGAVPRCSGPDGEGGLESGRVLLFGDFERQAIFENRRRPRAAP